MKKQLSYLSLLLIIIFLSACGGGGGGASQAQTASRTVKAVIKPSALAAGQNVAGINLTITIPLGVAPPLKTDGTADPAATVEISSSSPQNQNMPGATYIPATAAAPGKLSIFGIVASGFKATDSITIHLNIATGSIPTTSDFNLITFEAFDTNGAQVTGLSPTLTTTIY
jgi:hypothetical protein